MKKISKALLKVCMGSMLAWVFPASGAWATNALSAAKDVKNVQQQRSISGTVKDTKGDPIIGANVLIKGTTNGTITDIDGNFSLNVPNNVTLVVSFIGYETQEIVVGNKSRISVSLTEDMEKLDEVVVVGYGTQKKVNLTGAVDQVTSEVIENRPVSNLTQGLQGAIPNLQISFADGKPTRSSSYQVRGTSSIGQGGSALVLIDGVEGDPAMLNPSDVASVSVLKDAAASSIYGARGTYGVVLITTKNPNKERTAITYNGNFMVKAPTVVPNVISDGYEFTTYFLEGYQNWAGSKPNKFHSSLMYTDQWYEELAKHRPWMNAPDVEVDANGNYQYYGNTDWWDLLYKDHFIGQEQNLSIQGGGEKTDFLVSGRFYSQGGIFNFDPDRYKMFNVRAKGSLQVTPWLKVTNNFEFNQMQYHNPMSVGEGTVWYAIESEGQAPNVMFNPDGTLTKAGAYTLGSFYYKNNYQNTTSRVLRNTTNFTAKLLGERLTLNGDITFRYNDERIEGKQTPVPYSQSVGKINYAGAGYNSIMNTLSNTKYLATNVYAQYNQLFANTHDVKAMIGYNYEQSIYNYDFERRNGLLFDDAENINMATGSISINSDYQKWRIAGGFFRLNYGYKDRYLVEINGRYDGSSKFPTDQQWAFFPSASAGWRVSQEPFWKISPKVVSDLKIRASYGSLGNGNISPYQFQELFKIYIQNRLLKGEKPTTTSSPNPIPTGLTWETATTANVGVDISFLNGRLKFVGDYYIRKNKDMYVTGTQLPAVYGADAPKGNYADMTTKGWELTLTWRDQFKVGGKPFNYEIRGTLANAKSVIDSYPNDELFIGARTNSGDDHNYYKGMELGEIWGFVNDGYFTASDIDENGHIINGPDQSWLSISSNQRWAAGDVRLKDLNEDGKIDWGNSKVGDSGDRKIIGNRLPHYTFSLNVGADWQGIFVNAFFQGVGKQNWWPGSDNGMFWGQYSRPYSNIPKEMMKDVWSEENPNAYFPKYRGYISHQHTRILHLPQTKYLQNVAYIRLKNLQIGYTLPTGFVNKLGVQQTKVYVSLENIWTYTPFYKHIKQFDVESINGEDFETVELIKQGMYSSPIIEDGGRPYSYPIMKSMTLGLSLTF